MLDCKVMMCCAGVFPLCFLACRCSLQSMAVAIARGGEQTLGDLDDDFDDSSMDDDWGEFMDFDRDDWPMGVNPAMAQNMMGPQMGMPGGFGRGMGQFGGGLRPMQMPGMGFPGQNLGQGFQQGFQPGGFQQGWQQQGFQQPGFQDWNQQGFQTGWNNQFQGGGFQGGFQDQWGQGGFQDQWGQQGFGQGWGGQQGFNQGWNGGGFGDPFQQQQMGGFPGQQFGNGFDQFQGQQFGNGFGMGQDPWNQMGGQFGGGQQGFGMQPGFNGMGQWGNQQQQFGQQQGMFGQPFGQGQGMMNNGFGGNQFGVGGMGGGMGGGVGGSMGGGFGGGGMFGIGFMGRRISGLSHILDEEIACFNSQSTGGNPVIRVLASQYRASAGKHTHSLLAVFASTAIVLLLSCLS